MNDFILLTTSLISTKEPVESFPSQQPSEFTNDYFKIDDKNFFSLTKTVKSGQRRLRTETLSHSPDIQKLLPLNEDQNLANILIKYSNKPRGYSVLEEAIFQKDYSAIDLLVANGSSINTTHYTGRSPISLAVVLDDQKMIDYLLTKGGALSSSNLGYIAHQADATRRLSLLKMKGLDIKISQQILRELLPNISAELLELFLENGTDVKGLPKKRWAGLENPWAGILYFGMLRGDISIINLLIDHGAYLDDQWNLGGRQNQYNPLTIAINSDQEDIAKVLLEKGAIIPITDGKNSQISVLESAFTKKMYSVIPLIIERMKATPVESNYSRELNGNENKQGNLLQRAVEANDVNMVHALLEGGFDPNSKGSYKPNSALKMALAIGNREIIELLIQHHAKTDDI